MSIKKYSSGSWVTVPYRKYETATDTITSLPKTIIGDGQPISAYTIKGNMTQSGTPTPSNPVYPQETGDKTANLLDNANFENGGWDATIGTVPYKISNSKRCRYSTSISLSSNKLFYNFKTFMVNIIQIDQDGVSLGGTGFLTGAGTATLLSDATAFTLIIANADTSTNIDYTDVQAANISIDYGYKIPISFGQGTYTSYLAEPIRKIETAVDSLASTGIATRQIRKLELTGQESWYLYEAVASIPFPTYQFYTSGLNLGGITMSSAYCTIAPYGLTTSTRQNGEYGAYIVSSGADIGLQMYGSKSQFADVTAWTTYLQQQYAAGTPVTVWYVLATATTESFTAPSIPTSGTAQTFDVSTTLKPSEVSLTWHGWHEHSDEKYVGGVVNKFNKETATLGYYVSSSTGEIIQGGNYFATDYIPIEQGKTYYWNDSTTRSNAGCFYDSNKNRVSGWSNQVSGVYYFTAPTNAAYVRLTGQSADITTMQLNEGSTALPYHPYYEWVEQ